jgi:hypothetical protein
MSEPSLGALAAAAALSALVAGFLKTSVGGGIGLALTPVLSLLLPPSAVLGLIAVQLNLSDPISLRYYWGRWDPRQLRLLLPTTLAGVLLGAWVLSRLSESGIRRAIGSVALAAALVQLGALLGGLRLAGPDSHWSVGSGAGLLAGIASAVAHSGGIIAGPYLIGLGLSNAAVVATGTAVVAVSNVAKLLSYVGIGFLSWRLAGVALASVPLLSLGAWLGFRLNRRIPRTGFALVLIGIAIAGSLRLLAG